MTQRTVLVVEDEPAIADAVASRLRAEGFEVEIAGDGPTAVDTAATLRPDLVVLDLMLPGLDGLEVCRRIQAERRVPVLMLTARDSETDLLVGLAIGADDYLTKPFSPRELVARVHAILRRVGEVTGVSGNATPPRVAGDVEIDLDRRIVRHRGEPVHLTPLEFDLLAVLASRPGTVFNRLRLLAEVWGFDSGGTRTVDTHVQALRRKLDPELIRTVHGVGYALSDSPS